MLIFGVFSGAIVLMLTSFIVIGSEKDSYNKQKFYKFNTSAGLLFATLIYCMSDSLGKDTVVNYITNAIKIGINKGWIEFNQDDTQICDYAESIYGKIMEFFERGDI